MTGLSLAAFEWRAVDHARYVDWPVLAGTVLSWLLFAALVAVVVRAWLTRARYRHERVFGDRDREILADEIRRVERKTVGRISVVLTERSGEHAAADALAALVTSLVATALFSRGLPWDDPPRLVLWQLLFGAAGLGAARALPGFRRLFVGERRATEVAEARALEEFYSLGLHGAEGGSGVLVLVSLFERRAVVLGGPGARDAVSAEQWQRTTHAILEGMRRESLRVGLAEAVRRVGEILRDRFPRPAGQSTSEAPRLEVRAS